MPPDVAIDLARPADLPCIAALADRIWRAHYPGIISVEQIDYMLDRMYRLETLLEEVSSGQVCYLRLLRSGELIGFAAIGPDKSAGTAKLHKLYLLPEFHGQGLGSLLLAEAESVAAGAGARSVVLQVNKRNHRAIEAYRRNGYAVVREAILDIGGGFVMDDFIMEKPIMPSPTA